MRSRALLRWGVPRLPLLLAALVLLAAATLKLAPLLNPERLLWLTAQERISTALVAAIEMVAAVWLISGYRPRAAWAVVVGLFMVFAAVAAAKAVAGEASCGCFGAIEVDPRVTLLIDAIVLVGLLLAGPAVGGATTGAVTRPAAGLP